MARLEQLGMASGMDDAQCVRQQYVYPPAEFQFHASFELHWKRTVVA
jgi:hypothetical protein